MPELIFNESTHEYSYNGKNLISVTTLLQLEGAMTGMEFVDDFYRERGSMGHLMAQYYDLGILKEETLDPRMIGFLNSWKRFRDSTGIVYTKDQIEVQLADLVYGYAGTIDRLPLLDIKLGAPKKADDFQIGAYYGLCSANKIDTNLYLGDAARKIVYLNEDGKSPQVKHFTVKETMLLRDDFLSALRWHNAKNR